MLARALIVILLTLNVGTALWWWSHLGSSVEEATPTASDVASLQLLSELHTGIAGLISEGGRCLAFGPFQSSSTLDAAVSYLQPRVTRFEVLAHAAQPRSWRVISPPHADESEALQFAARLEVEGFDDHVVTRTGQEYVVALGLFSGESAARSRALALQQAGFEASVVVAPAVAAGSWVNVVVSPDFDSESAQAVIAAEQAQPLVCD